MMQVQIDNEELENKRGRLSELVAALGASSAEEVVARFVPFFKVTKTFDDRWKIRYKMVHPEHAQLIAWFMVGSGAQPKYGKAPRGKMVRSVEKWLTRK